MYTKLFFGIGLVLILAGVFLPMWYVALVGLLLISIASPFSGIVCGFILDLLFGMPPSLPALIAFPFMFAALAAGLISLLLKDYIRA